MCAQYANMLIVVIGCNYLQFFLEVFLYLTVNGNEETLYADKFEHEELVRWVEHLRTRSGKPITKMGKPWHTDNPSIQGTWTPFTNRPTAWNVTQFPSEEYSSIPEKEVSATDKLLAMAAQLRAKGVEEPQQ